MVPFVSLIDRPGLAAEAAKRGLTSAPDGQLVLARVDDVAGLADARTRWPGRPVIAVAPAAMHAALFDAGADDVVAPDVDDAALAARLAAWLRRAPAVVRVGDLAIDTVTRRTTRGEHALPLLQREYALLLHLARQAGRTVSRAELREAVLGRAFDPGTNVIEVHMSRLRAKLDRGFAVPMLFTEKGIGYRLAPGG